MASGLNASGMNNKNFTLDIKHVKYFFDFLD